MSAKDNLIAQALKLPLPDRVEIAERVLESIEGPSDPDAEQAWAAELQRRLHLIDSSQAQLIPWEEARQRIHQDTD